MLATIALFVYAAIVLALFKLIPVTLSLAGLAGFVLSVGMAVDANVLIFERTATNYGTGEARPSPSRPASAAHFRPFVTATSRR